MAETVLFSRANRGFSRPITRLTNHSQGYISFRVPLTGLAWQRAAVARHKNDAESSAPRLRLYQAGEEDATRPHEAPDQRACPLAPYRIHYGYNSVRHHVVSPNGAGQTSRMANDHQGRHIVQKGVIRQQPASCGAAWDVTIVPDALFANVPRLLRGLSRVTDRTGNAHLRSGKRQHRLLSLLN